MCIAAEADLGFLNQASPLGGIRDPERDSKSPKGAQSLG